MKDILVSVNIPTLNSERTLEKCLESVKNQTYPNIELIVIDSYSKDKTVEIAKKYGAKIYYAKTLSEARKIGARKSKGEYILLLDSDQTLEPMAIEKCVKTIKNGYDALILHEKSIALKNTYAAKIIAYDREIVQKYDDPIYGDALPRFFKSKFLKEVNWPKNLVTFDHIFLYYQVAKSGANIGYVDAIYYHYELTTFRQIAKKFYRYGLHYIPALKQNKKLVLAHSLPRQAYFNINALKKTTLYFGLILVYIIRATAAACGAVVYLLKSMRKIKWKRIHLSR